MTERTPRRHLLLSHLRRADPSEEGRSPHYRFARREGNRFELLVDGRQFFPSMLEAIRQARAQVLLEMYLCESGQVADRFIEALGAAAARGVTVALLLDDYGAAGLLHRDRERLREAGVHLATYNPLHYGRLRRNLFRDHRKLLAIDGALAFVGGTGITDDFDHSDATTAPWHEVMVRVHGPCAADWTRLFLHTWDRWSSVSLSPLAAEPALPGGSPGRVIVSEPARTEVKRVLVKHLRGAQQRIWLSTAYFIPSLKVRRALRRAARRGVDVRLLLPGPCTDHPPVRHASRRYYHSLLRHGVRIFEYQPSFLHAKVMLCDGWVSIGSTNIDRWNLRWNLEANQEADDPALATAVEAFFVEGFRAGSEQYLAQWRKRPLYLRLLEEFWGVVERWLERRSQHRRHEEDV